MHQSTERGDVRDWIYKSQFIFLKVLLNTRHLKLHFTYGETKWGCGKSRTHETQATAELSKAKNGILKTTVVPPREYMLGRWLKRWLKSTQREARCNQASKMRMTTSALVDWKCLTASLSAGHHQERLWGNLCDPIVALNFTLKGGLHHHISQWRD